MDVILKSICKELGNQNANRMDIGYTPTILTKWPKIKEQKVRFRDIQLEPLSSWMDNPYQSPNWWSPYNDVKHERIRNYKSANLKNVLNALAGLFILENYFVKFIGDRDNDMDVPNDVSSLFEMIEFETREKVIGRDIYDITPQDILQLD